MQALKLSCRVSGPRGAFAAPTCSIQPKGPQRSRSGAGSPHFATLHNRMRISAVRRVHWSETKHGQIKSTFTVEMVELDPWGTVYNLF